jgi:hypothetical protein
MTAGRSKWERGHRRHFWFLCPTSHIRNVHYLLTHDLINCSCGWYGWVPQEEQDASDSSPERTSDA